MQALYLEGGWDPVQVELKGFSVRKSPQKATLLLLEIQSIRLPHDPSQNMPEQVVHIKGPLEV